MSLTSMKMSKKEAKGEFAMEANSNRFPHGLSINLDNDTMKKLGMEMPDVGEQMIIVGVGPVTHASEHRRQNGVQRSVTIQLETMEVGELDDKSALKAVSAAVKDA
jgi:hypothetical protein